LVVIILKQSLHLSVVDLAAELLLTDEVDGRFGGGGGGTNAVSLALGLAA
jgi:hypothetical protein